MLTVQSGPIQVQHELPVICGHQDCFDEFHQFLSGSTVENQVFDRAHPQFVSTREAAQLRESGHGTVVIHDLTNDANWLETSELSEIHGGLGMAGAPKDAALFGA